MRKTIAKASYSCLFFLKKVQYCLLSGRMKKRFGGEGNVYVRMLYEVLYRFLNDNVKNGYALTAHHARKFARMELRGVHRKLFHDCKKECTTVSWTHSTNHIGTRNRVFVTCHTDTMWENIPEIMDAFDLDQLTLVATKRGYGESILRRILARYEAKQMESDIEVYESPCDQYKGKRVYMLYVEEGVRYLKNLHTLLDLGVPFLIAYDGFVPPRQEVDSEIYWTFRYRGRPVVQIPRILAKIVHRFSLDAVFLYSHRDDKGIDLVLAESAVLGNYDDVGGLTDTLYQQFFTFVFKHGTRFEDSWQGLRIFSPSIPKLWKPSNASSFVPPQSDLVPRLSKDVMIFPAPERNAIMLIKPYPFAAIKVTKRIYRALSGHRTAPYRNEVPKDLLAVLHERQYFSDIARNPEVTYAHS